VFEELDQWMRRKLRRVLWKQWKRMRTCLRELVQRGIPRDIAWRTAYNGHGPWFNATTPAMHRAVPTSTLRDQGLISLLEEHRRLASAY
jgi:RNA-directed DNA polymerase